MNVDSEPHILLVDDDDVVRTVIAKVLENSGYIISSAANGIEALEKLEHGTVDLIITDLNMPQMDGWALIDNIQKYEMHRDTPIMLLSGDCNDANKQRAQAAGIDLLLPKDMGAAVIRVQAKKIINNKTEV
ncbi:MAG: response regulator [Planctomycetes bacterium]|nr:response regulator [Planctomycetota bacterium]